MKSIYLLFLSMVVGYATIAQVRSYYAVLDTNDMAIGFHANGIMFSDSGWAKFRVPKNQQANAVWAGGLWVVGIDHAGNIYSSSITYTGLQAGSYSSASANATEKAKWNTIWSIKRNDVLNVKNDFDIHHAITQPIPYTVLAWPAKGNGNAKGAGGAALTIASDMAPFYDRNGDGVYNVYDGDYPMMKGDKMLWWVYNDSVPDTIPHVGIEVRVSAYEYSSTDTILNNSLFMSFDVVNKSIRTYDSLRMGKYIDQTFGCGENDRIASMPSKNTFYVYNGVIGTSVCDQGTACITGTIGYGCTFPILSATFLNQTMRSFVEVTGFPATAAQYNNYINGKWQYGLPVTYGGDGSDSFGTPYPFVYPGNPADSTQWSLCHTQDSLIPSQSRLWRTVASVGPFTAQPNTSTTVDMVYIFNNDIGSALCPDINLTNTSYIDSIKHYYNTETFPIWYDSTKSLSPRYRNVGIVDMDLEVSFKVIPNPNNGHFTIQVADAYKGNYHLTISDMLGRVVMDEHLLNLVEGKAIDLSNASNGVYLITLEIGGQKMVKRVMVGY